MDYTKVLHDEFNIPSVYVDKLDDKVLDDIISAMDEIYNKYPALINALSSFGSHKDILKEIHVNMDSDLLDSNIFGNECIEKINKRSYYISYIGLGYSNKLTGKSYDEVINYINNNSITMDKSIKYMIYHEYGHIISNCLGLHYNIDLIKAFRLYTLRYHLVTSKVSKYAALYKKDEKKVIEESIAEIFAISHLYPELRKSKIMKIVFDMLNEEYKEKGNNIEFVVNYKTMRKVR